MNVELKHTVTVGASAWWLRLYLWVYDADPNRVTFCKLFWGFLLMPFGMALHFLGYMLDLGSEILKYLKLRKPEETHWERAKRRAETRLERINKRRAQEERESSQEAWLDKVGLWFARMHVDWTKTDYIDRLIGIVVVTAGLAMIGGIIFVIVLFWPVTQWVLLGIVALVAAVGLAIGFGYVLATVFKHEVTRVYVYQPVGRGAEATAYTTKIAGVGFWSMLKMGYVAVKSNTCPKIEVKG